MLEKAMRRLRKFTVTALLVAMMLQFVVVANAADISVQEARPTDAMLQMYLALGTDQRSEAAKASVHFTPKTALMGSQTREEKTSPQMEMATLLVNKQVDERGKIREQYVTVARASNRVSSNVEQAGELTAFVMIEWAIEYDPLFGGNNIGFVESRHGYHDAGNSGVSRVYGENYTALGNDYGENEQTWYGLSSNEERSLDNETTGKLSWDAPNSDNCTATARTIVYASSVGSLLVDFTMNW